MKRIKIQISPFTEAEESDNAAFYSIGFENQDSEPRKFYNKYNTNEFKREFDTVLTRIELIACSGAEARHFRYAGTPKDNAMELPSEEDKCILRLYCLRLNNEIVILGNGDIKETRTYQQDPILNDYVETLIAVDKVIKILIANGSIKINGKQLSGRLNFEIQLP